MAIYKNTPPIVTNGLVLALDAANPKSYVSGSTNWRDLSGNGKNFTTTGVTYAPENGGILIWDNSLDRVDSTTNIGLSAYTSATVGFWLKTTDTRFVTFCLNGGSPYLGAFYPAGTGNVNWYHSGVGSPVSYTNGISSLGPSVNNTWNYYTFTNCNFSSGWNSITTIFYYATGWELETGSLSSFSIYSRSLSQAEILQNYNATKGRFGL